VYPRMHQRLSVSLMAILISASTAVAQENPQDGKAAILPLVISNDTFTNGAGTGLWNNASNWSSGLPSSSNNVLITGAGSAAAVTQNVAATINNLTLNSANSWTLSNAETLTIDGNAISNAGKMLLNSTGNATELIIGSPSVTLSGGGTLTMSNNANNYIFGSAAADVLLNQETIQGAGHIGNGSMTLINSGTIDANQSAGMTIQPNGGTSNAGTLEATADATLGITGTTVYNTGGTISASGTGSLVQITNSNVYGGTVSLTGASTLQLENGTIQFGSTLNNSSTGTIESVGGTTNTLGGTISNPAGGLLKIDNGSALNLASGSYPTLGAVQLNSTGNSTQLIIDGAATLSGGTVTLSNNANNYIWSQSAGDTLTNQETIQGAGHIGNGQMTLINSGTIDANQSAGMTIQPNGGTTNTGTIEVGGGATLNISGTTVANAGGTISSNASVLQVTNTTVNGGAVTLTGASNLQLLNGTIQGGALTNSSTGTIESVGGTTNTLGGAINNPAGGILKLDNGSALHLLAGAYPTLGAVQLNSTGSSTQLVINGSATLSGGSVTMSNNPNNYIWSESAGDTLTNQETIQGAGHIGNGQMTLINSGTINANASSGMTIQPNGGTTNTGTIEVGGGATLNISGTTVANTGGTISSNASILQVTNTTVNGGAVTLTGASNLQLLNGTIQGGALTNSSTGTIESVGGTTNTLGGTINNPAGGILKLDNGSALHLLTGAYPTLGAVQLNSTGSSTQLVINGAATLSGGSVTMSNNPNNYIWSESTGDTLTNQETIQGAGHIGNGQMTLINSGTIDANQSAGMTIQPNGGTTNTGTIEVGGGATLNISGTTVANAGGTISSNASVLQVTNTTINGGAVTLTGASNLQLLNGTIQNGALTNSSTGTIESVGGTTNTLGGTINNPAGGILKLDNGSALHLLTGAYPTLGAVQLNSTGNSTQLVINGAATLSGGSVTMSNNPNNYIWSEAAGDTLTNQETIQGSGNIGNGQMTLVNSGTINANQSNTLLVQTNAFTNNGTLQVSSGSLLHVEGGIFTNFNPITKTLTGGTYNTSGTLEIDNLGSAGGEIVTNAANIVLNGSSSTFVDSGSKNVLSNLATNAPGSSFTVSGGRTFTTAGNFTNNGSLVVGSGSNFTVNGSLTNFSGTTLTGGIYNVSGTLQFNSANIVTNAANITLNGTSSQILNQSSANGIANFATNAAGGAFTIQGGRTFTTVGSFSNAGAFTIGTGSTFTIGGTGSYTQTAGTTTDDGTLTLPSAGKLNLNSGSLFGLGAITGAVASSGAITPGNSATSTGILKDTGAYTQNSGGTLNIAINGTTAGTSYDQFNPSTAVLNGTLNITRPTGFVPTVGSTFKIMNFSSETGNFATVNGLAINSSEHFTVTVQSTDVLLTVVSGAASTSPIRSFRSSALFASDASNFKPSIMPVIRSATDRPLSYRIASPAPELPRTEGPGRHVAAHKLLSYNLNLLSLFTGNRGEALHNLWKQPGDPYAPSFGSLSFSGSH
jgi:fibronectin-binding autotransporter adhesin